MSTHAATVSLYVPCRNAENHIKRTLESVFSQTYPISQVIVMDDGSTDQTTKILGSFPIQVIRHSKNLGITKTRNTALEHALGEFVASVDADVVLEPDWLKKIMANFSEKSVAGVGGRIIETNTEPLIGQWIMAHRNPDGGEKKKKPACLPAGAVVYRKRALLEIGGFNDDKRYDHSDLDASMRVVQIGYVLAYEPEAICYHHFQGDVRSLFDGPWNFRKDGYVNCGLFTNRLGLQRKIRINLGEFHQMLMDDFNAGRHDIMHLNVIGALHHSLMDIRLYYQLHPDNEEKTDAETFEALKLGLRYILKQKEHISRPLARVISDYIQDIFMDSETEDCLIEFSGKAGQGDLHCLIKDRYPQADLDRISNWLIMVQGFLNSFSEKVWDTMNRSAIQDSTIHAESRGIESCLTK